MNETLRVVVDTDEIEPSFPVDSKNVLRLYARVTSRKSTPSPVAIILPATFDAETVLNAALVHEKSILATSLAFVAVVAVPVKVNVATVVLVLVRTAVNPAGTFPKI